MKYRTIVADPPWPLAWTGGATNRKNGRGVRYNNGRASVKALPYPTMSLASIATLDVASLAEDDAHLYLWVPDALLLKGVGVQIAEAWGFKPLRSLVWAKTGFGQGTFPRPQHESVVVCRRGDLGFQIRDAGSIHRWSLTYERGSNAAYRRHSAKPDGFFDLVERASPGPYVELFSRRQRLGWDYRWGDFDMATDSQESEAP